LRNRIIFVTSIVIVALIVSLMFNLHYYVNISRENKKVLHNMRALALASYGSEVVVVAYFLEQYLETLDLDIIDKEVSWGLWRAEIEADVCCQGDSGLMYYELRKTAFQLMNYFVWGLNAPFNTTKVEIIAEALYHIGYSFNGLDIIQNKDPLDRLYQSSIDEVIGYCRQIQEIV
jgi:hypothetical protein